MPLWSLLPSWAAAFQTPGGLWVILPTGQGSFLLSPETPSSSHLTCFLGVTCVLGFACSHLSPARIPPCRRPQGVSPAWSQSSGSHHCLPLYHPLSQGPQRSLRRLITARLHQHPGVLASLQRVGMLRGHAGCGCPSLSSWSCVSHLLRALSVLGAVCVLLRVG